MGLILREAVGASGSASSGLGGGVVHLDVGHRFNDGIDIVKSTPSEPNDYQAFIPIGDLTGATIIVTGENTYSARSELNFTIFTEPGHSASDQTYIDIGQITEKDYGDDGLEFIIQNHSNKAIALFRRAIGNDGVGTSFTYTNLATQPDEIPVDGTALVHLSYDADSTPPEQVDVTLLDTSVSGGGVRHLDVGGSTGVGIVAIKKYTNNELVERQRPIAFDDLDGGTLILTGTNETPSMPDLVFSVVGHEDERLNPTGYGGRAVSYTHLTLPTKRIV